MTDAPETWLPDALRKYNPNERPNHCAELMFYAADTIEKLVDAADLSPQWQPISTAPKDGTKVILFCSKAERSVKWREGQQAVDFWHTVVKNGYEGWGHFNEGYFPASHWQNLPKPPA